MPSDEPNRTSFGRVRSVGDMSVWGRKTTMPVGAATIEVPDIMTSGGEPIDSDAAYLQGDGLWIVSDQGPF